MLCVLYPGWLSPSDCPQHPDTHATKILGPYLCRAGSAPLPPRPSGTESSDEEVGEGLSLPTLPGTLSAGPTRVLWAPSFLPSGPYLESLPDWAPSLYRPEAVLTHAALTPPRLQRWKSVHVTSGLRFLSPPVLTGGAEIRSCTGFGVLEVLPRIPTGPGRTSSTAVCVPSYQSCDSRVP